MDPRGLSYSIKGPGSGSDGGGVFDINDTSDGLRNAQQVQCLCRQRLHLEGQSYRPSGIAAADDLEIHLAKVPQVGGDKIAGMFESNIVFARLRNAGF